MKEFITALGALMIAFGAAKLILFLIQRRKEDTYGNE